MLPDQMAEDGSFPRELAQTQPYSYSIFNFDVMAGLCQSLKGLTPDPPEFELADGRGLSKAADFLYPYLKDKSAWKWAKDVEHFDAVSPILVGTSCQATAPHNNQGSRSGSARRPDRTGSIPWGFELILCRLRANIYFVSPASRRTRRS